MAGNLKVAATIVEAVETEKRGERGDTAKEGKGRRKSENDSVTDQTWRDPTGCLA